MKPSRRRILQAGSAALALGGCDSSAGWNALARRLEPRERIGGPPDDPSDPAAHVLGRAGFGARPGDAERLRRIGVGAYVREQLAPERIDDSACEVRVRRFETLHARAGDLFEYKRKVVEDELVRVTILRAVHSRRQLFEAMVHFWTDHFNVGLGKGDCAWLKTADDRDVIRRHALGSFRDLVRASALSPAMLVYLDGQANRRGVDGGRPNENYARELLELHTLGVRGGYTQQDVMEAARCLTGWTVRKKWNRGGVEFDPTGHDDGAKEVLGVRIPAGGGERDLDLLLDAILAHPSTAEHLAGKLCRRFVADAPPPGLVARVAAAFRESGGRIAPTLERLFLSEEFLAARGTRLKRPFDFVVSALRALDADTDGGPALQAWLARMGQSPFGYPTPDGYPDEPEPWLGTLLWRWNFAAELAGNGIKGTRVDLDDLAGGAGEALAAHLLGRQPSPEEGETIRSASRGLAPAAARELSVALLLASPAFQMH